MVHLSLVYVYIDMEVNNPTVGSKIEKQSNQKGINSLL